MNDILLVDDEPEVLKNLSTSLDWAEYGFANVHTAYSAEEALLVMKKNPIDLIILDIQMPQMTGLEMLRIIRSKYPYTHCVLISAYSKFEYAKEALQLDVENYLVKPINLNELWETVTHAADNIRKASSSSHNLFERNLLERWLYGRITSEELLEHSQYTHYNVLMRRYYAVVVRLAHHAGKALHLLTSMLPHDFAAYTLNVDNDTGILLFGGHDVSDLYIEEASSSIVAAYPNIHIICGSCALGYGEVSKSLDDAYDALEYARLSGYTGYLSFSGIEHNFLSPAQLVALNDILQLTPSKHQISDFTAQLTDPAAGFSGDYRSLYARICQTCMNLPEAAELKGIALPAFSAPCTQEGFEDAVAKAVLMISNARQHTQPFSPIIQRVVRYIHDNLNKPISIKLFCEQTNMNPTYIGRLFHEELGIYFSEYVSDIRISKAKLLLENTSFSVSDIARQVGIYDVSYFVQCFKKKERISPMKYRQSVLQNKAALKR